MTKTRALPPLTVTMVLPPAVPLVPAARSVVAVPPGVRFSAEGTIRGSRVSMENFAIARLR